jgi:SAM-dependent methyltransferase
MNQTISRSEAGELCELLTRLYTEQIKTSGSTPYLIAHSSREFVKHQVNVFLWYLQYLPEAGAILDWGCNYGPDSCLIRKVFNERLDLYACDFQPEFEYSIFRNYAKPKYTQLNHPIGLPYPENTFDVVIGSGVLEHTAMDHEALKALFQVLKPEGLLIITYLPFRWSWSEWHRRRILKTDFHRRLYGKREAEELLKRWGFYPIETIYQTFVPDVVDGKLPTRLKRLLAPVRHPVFSHSVLCSVAKKMNMM